MSTCRLEMCIFSHFCFSVVSNSLNFVYFDSFLSLSLPLLSVVFVQSLFRVQSTSRQAGFPKGVPRERTEVQCRCVVSNFTSVQTSTSTAVLGCAVCFAYKTAGVRVIADKIRIYEQRLTSACVAGSPTVASVPMGCRTVADCQTVVRGWGGREGGRRFQSIDLLCRRGRRWSSSSYT